MQTSPSRDPSVGPTAPGPDHLITLDRAHRAQELLRGIAHDLRNNLQVFALGSSLGGTEFADRIDRAIAEMAAVLDLLGDLGRHRTDDPAATPLTETLRQAVHLAGLQRNAPTVAVALDAPEDLPAVAMPAWALLQIVLGLVQNAKEAVGEDGPAIRVAAARSLDGRAIEVVVDDRGPGRPEGPFVPFASGKPAASHGGIGLFAAARLAERYRGSLTVAPRGGGGTRATLRLPAAPDPARVSDRG